MTNSDCFHMGRNDALCGSPPCPKPEWDQDQRDAYRRGYDAGVDAKRMCAM